MNQKTNVFTAGFVLILGAVLLLGAGCTQKAATLTGKLTGQLTNEDKCVELMAYSVVGFQYGQSGNMAAIEILQQKVDNFKKQSGWSDEDFQNNCKTFSDQKGFMERAAKRMQEIMSEIK